MRIKYESLEKSEAEIILPPYKGEPLGRGIMVGKFTSRIKASNLAEMFV